MVIVLDTLRADAVSAYGEVTGTTPILDSLAEKGILYRNVFAPSPWTLTSHVSLFSGLDANEHGVGLSGRSQTPESLRLLAEDFRSAGYVTAGFSENTIVSSDFGLDQGFEIFASTDVTKAFDAELQGEDPASSFGLVDRVRDWSRTRDPDRPYFLFVNILDPHDPYLLRDDNPWVPSEAPPGEVAYAASAYRIPFSICDRLPAPTHLPILRGLYLGDVAAADAKLGRILSILDEGRSPEEPRVLLVTSDHGEHLGEHRLMQHRFSVRSQVLKVPLIVTGLTETATGVVDQAVGMHAAHDALLCWALEEGCPASLPLPGDEVSETKDLLSFYSDSSAEPAQETLDQLAPQLERIGIEPTSDPSRSKCRPSDPVFGEMISLIRYPMKMNWVQGHDPMLYDLSWDPAERSNQFSRQPEIAAELWREVEPYTRARLADRASAGVPELSDEEARALKSLGYLE
ncbi:MAG: sulfatase [bacterium]